MGSKLVLIGLLPLAACGENSNAPAPSAGFVEVTVTTTGTTLDQDGYTVILDPQGPSTQTQTVAVNGGTASYSDVAPGQHTVELQDVAANCVVDPSTSQSVTVPPGRTPSLSFTIACTSSPRSTRIAFTSERDENREIYVMEVDGTGQTRLTNDIGTDIMPAWSPDGSKIAFLSDRADSPDIYVMNPDGSDLTNLTQAPGSDASPSWSPDGGRIVFVRYVGENPAIFVMNADGSGVARLTDQAGDNPAWSPDGTQIAFESVQTGGMSVMNADGSNLHLIAFNALRPAWSPDGTRIAYQGLSLEADPGLYLMNADGSNIVALTSDRDDAPAWSPDGTQIAFDRQQPEHFGQEEIYVINADGSGLTRLTNNPAPDQDPTWAP